MEMAMLRLIVLVYGCVLLCGLSGSYGLQVQPEQIHISWTAHPNEMSITWYTVDSTADSVVHFGVVSGAYSLHVNGSQLKYSDPWKGFVHTAILPDLVPQTRYYYICGGQGAFSKEYSFINGIWGSTDRPLQFAWYGDMGLGASSTDTAKSLLKLVGEGSIDGIFHFGDIGYADFDGETKGNQTVWNDYMNEMEPITAQVPYMVVPGNHDVFYGSKMYAETFYMPNHQATKSAYYAFTYGGINFIGISTEMNYLPYSAQREWIKKALQQFNSANSENALTIMFAHRAMYCSNAWQWCNGNIERYGLRWSIDDLLHDYNVNMFIAGHTHSYERTYPVFKEAVQGTYDNPKGTVHMTVGTPGAQEGLDMDWQPSPKWSASHYSEFGFGLMTVVNKTQIHWRYIVDSTFTAQDEFTLVASNWA